MAIDSELVRKYFEGYLQRPSVVSQIESNRKLREAKFRNLGILGEGLAFAGSFMDDIAFFLEAMGQAKYKGYSFEK